VPTTIPLNEPARGVPPARRRLALCLAALTLLPSLSGCIAAAVAIPVAAAAGMIGKNVHVRAATKVPKHRGASSEAGRAELASTGPRSVPGATLTTLTALPPPSGLGTTGDPWLPFVSYALARAKDDKQTDSALLAPGAAVTMTGHRLPCPEKPPAVVVDLDDGPTTFVPGTAGLPAPGLAESLARLREAGIVVLWVSQIDANKVREVADALQLSGLDPAGHDPLLLVRNRDERKQTLRQEANLDVCVIAIAGDRRSDFDELFDYLRNPDAALGLEGMIGSGWFIEPVPFGTAAP